MLRQNHQDLEGNDRYEGFCVDMLKELADILKFKYRIRLVGDGLYGVPGTNGTWTGMVGELISRVCRYICLCRIRQQPPSVPHSLSSSNSWPFQLKHCSFQDSHCLLMACSPSASFLKPFELTRTDFSLDSVCVVAAYTVPASLSRAVKRQISLFMGSLGEEQGVKEVKQV